MHSGTAFSWPLRAERDDGIVTLGIRPSHGATGYGYLRLAEAPGSKVRR